MKAFAIAAWEFRRQLKFLLIYIIILFFISCNNKIKPSSLQKLKARFEIAGLCSNYTFSLIDGNIDMTLVVSRWTNPQTNKTYSNAFAVSNPCNLPKNLKEGNEFYFVIDDTSKKDCITCMAYYPTPEKKLSIRVLEVVKK